MTTMPTLFPAIARHWLADVLDRWALRLLVLACRLRKGAPSSSWPANSERGQ